MSAAAEPLEKVVETLREVFENKGQQPPEQLGAETPLDQTLGLESMDFAELVVRLEEVFGADPFRQGTPPRLATLGDLARCYA